MPFGRGALIKIARPDGAPMPRPSRTSGGTDPGRSPSFLNYGHVPISFVDQGTALPCRSDGRAPSWREPHCVGRPRRRAARSDGPVSRRRLPGHGRTLSDKFCWPRRRFYQAVRTYALPGGEGSNRRQWYTKWSPRNWMCNRPRFTWWRRTCGYDRGAKRRLLGGAGRQTR
jgi:hypothetical protein